MQTYKITIKGTAPLLQNKQLENIKKPGRQGADHDSAELAELKLYKVGKTIVQPAIHLEQCLIETAAGFKVSGAGKKSYKQLFKGALFIKPEMIEHQNQKYEIHQSSVVIPSTKGRITRYRPMLKDWLLTFTIEVLDERITEETLKQVLDEAGRTKGIGDYRPRMGRFIISSFAKA